MVSKFLNLLRLKLCPNTLVWLILINVPCALQKNVHSLVGESVLYVAIRSTWFVVLFKSSISLRRRGRIIDEELELEET